MSAHTPTVSLHSCQLRLSSDGKLPPVLSLPERKKPHNTKPKMLPTDAHHYFLSSREPASTKKISLPPTSGSLASTLDDYRHNFSLL